MTLAWIPPPRSAGVRIYNEAGATAMLHPNPCAIGSPGASENARCAGDLLLDCGAAARVSSTVRASIRFRFAGEGVNHSRLLTDAEGYGDSTTLLRPAGNGLSWDEQNDGREHNDNCECRDLSESGFHLFLLFAVRLSENVLRRTAAGVYPKQCIGGNGDEKTAQGILVRPARLRDAVIIWAHSR